MSLYNFFDTFTECDHFSSVGFPSNEQQFRFFQFIKKFAVFSEQNGISFEPMNKSPKNSGSFLDYVFVFVYFSFGQKDHKDAKIFAVGCSLKCNNGW